MGKGKAQGSAKSFFLFQIVIFWWFELCFEIRGPCSTPSSMQQCQHHIFHRPKDSFLPSCLSFRQWVALDRSSSCLLSKPCLCALGQRECMEGKAHSVVRAFTWEVGPGPLASLNSLTRWSSLSTPMILDPMAACRHRQESWLPQSTRLVQGWVGKQGEEGWWLVPASWERVVRHSSACPVHGTRGAAVPRNVWILFRLF